MKTLTSELLKMRIRNALLSAQIVQIKIINQSVTTAQAEKQLGMIVNRLYKDIASLEPTHESEVI